MTGITVETGNVKPKARRTGPTKKQKRLDRIAQAQRENQCMRIKRNGQRCNSPPVHEPARATCRMHGGRGGRPIIHGRYSLELPQRLRAPYEASLQDKSLLDLTETIAMLDALVRVQGVRVGEKDTPEFRQNLLAIVDKMIDDKDNAHLHLNALVALVRQGADETMSENELGDRVERLSKRIEEFNKIKLQKQNVINGADLVVTLQTFVAVWQRILPPDLFDKGVAEIEGMLHVEMVDRRTLPGVGARRN